MVFFGERERKRGRRVQIIVRILNCGFILVKCDQQCIVGVLKGIQMREIFSVNSISSVVMGLLIWFCKVEMIRF